jgi:uncharacterized membrane-anchored protein YitT (DUF2179 family)
MENVESAMPAEVIASRSVIPHTPLEDVQAILFAAAFASLGVAFLRHGGLLTGGTAGIALLTARLTRFSFGQIYFVLNLPFFWLGVRQLGWRFTVKTFAAIGVFSLASDHIDGVLHLGFVAPVYGALLGGALVGTGLLMLFRHDASLGGLNILAIHLQRRFGVRAGVFQMVVDASIVVASAFVVSLTTLLLSVAGAVALNLVLAVNHRPGRYLGA